MRARTHLIRIQRALYDRLHAYSRRFLGKLTPELKRYFREYQRDFRDYKEVSTKRELLANLQKAHIALCGDYHTLAQAQKTVIRLLRDTAPVLKRRGRKLVLALEMLRPRDDAKVARFLAGSVTEAGFLEGIDFQKNWGFNWENYRRLFHFAREHGIRIVGMNGAGPGGYHTLAARDRFSAKVITKLTARDPDALVFVLVGDLHLAGSHLPRELSRELSRRDVDRKLLVIHQNDERLYWKLAEQGLEQLVDVVKVRDSVYCVMNTPPWVKLQSHVKWSELMVETESRSPVLGRGKGKKASDYTLPVHEVDYTDEIRDLVHLIIKFLGEGGTAAVDDFTVATPANLAFLDRLDKEGGFSGAEARLVDRCLAEFESHFIPRLNVIYLTSLSLNHAATQAAIYLHGKLSGFRGVFQSPSRDFYGFVWVEALGFLGSRIVNPKRKCNGPTDLERIVAQGGPRDRRDAAGVARKALAHLGEECRFQMKGGGRFRGIPLPTGRSTENRIVFYYQVAKVLGQILGQAIHLAVMANRVSREEVRSLFESDPRNGEARARYLAWGRRLDELGFRHITKTERL